VTRTVDLVVVGGDRAGLRTALAAARRGERVLVVLGPEDRTAIERVRRSIRSAGGRVRRQVTVMTGSEVVCVDGVGGVEAVVVRRVGSARLIAFNARAVAAGPRGLAMPAWRNPL
jgi:thioredoxin reductase